jgi:HSP20 family molecular chaperone IbpA
LNPTKYVAVLLLLGCLALALAQQPVPQTSPSPSGSTPPTFPPDTSAPEPTQKASPEKPPRPLTSQEVKIEVVQKLLTTPGLDSKDIAVKVGDDKVLLKGSVPSADQRTLAQQVAQSSAGKRRVENRLSVVAQKDGASKDDKKRK